MNIWLKSVECYIIEIKILPQKEYLHIDKLLVLHIFYILLVVGFQLVFTTEKYINNVLYL